MYTRDELVAINSLTSDTVKYRITNKEWTNIKNLKLCRNKPTRRGTRGGQRRQREIKSKITANRPLKNKVEHKVNPKNLIQIPLNSQLEVETKGLKVILINARSVNNKAESISEYITERKVDVCCITETWLKEDDDINTIVCGNLTPPGYSLLHTARKGKQGGGVAIVHRSSLKVIKQTVNVFESFEHIEVLLQTGSDYVRLAVVYRPPSSSKSKFTEDFTTYLENHALSSGKLLILGDFNIHIEDPSDQSSLKLKDILFSLNLNQNVKDATHEKGRILDLVITRSDETFLQKINVTPCGFSDHHIISFYIPGSKPNEKQSKIKTRNLKAINIDALKEDIEKSSLIIDPPHELDELVQCYNTTLTNLMDKHAPLQEKVIRLQPQAPWFNESIQKAKQDRRRAERKYKKSKLVVDYQIIKEKHCIVQEMCATAKQRYYSEKINNNNGDSKTLFQIANTLLHKQKNTSLPSHTSPAKLADRFASYFTEKIDNIRKDLSNINDPIRQHSPSGLTTGPEKKPLEVFQEVEEDAVSKLIISGNSKSCCLDPIPTKILKQVLPTVTPTITSIINKSLMQSHMPISLKQAVVTPLLKKASLDKENLKNFRPVSNLPFIGKCIEKMAIKQMETHLRKNGLIEPLQSAYKQHHSTETALIKVSNDILMELDNRKCVYLVLLDLSAAFDTVDHQVFLTQMQTQYGMDGNVHDWMRSYLQDRQQCVHVNGAPSYKVELQYGFPQGSCVGPFGFKLYTKPLTAIAKHHGINIHLYADDTQLYTSFLPKDSESALERMEECIEEIRQWMGSHFLKLNDEKTEFMLFGTENDIKQVTGWTVSVGGAEILPSRDARNIGAYLDPQMKMTVQISKTIRACYCQLRSISKIKRFLTKDAVIRLCHAFITSRIDNMNALLHELPDYQLLKIQRVINSTARLIHPPKPSEHTIDILKQLHWLPVKERIIFKIVLLVFKCLNNEGPSYLSDLLVPYKPCRVLRSSEKGLLKETAGKKGYGDRAFSRCAPKLWNALPLHVRQSNTTAAFKSALKTHLFRESYLNTNGSVID